MRGLLACKSTLDHAHWQRVDACVRAPGGEDDALNGDQAAREKEMAAVCVTVSERARVHVWSEIQCARGSARLRHAVPLP